MMEVKIESDVLAASTTSNPSLEAKPLWEQRMSCILTRLIDLPGVVLIAAISMNITGWTLFRHFVILGGVRKAVV
jgi:hypothetical protein